MSDVSDTSSCFRSCFCWVSFISSFFWGSWILPSSHSFSLVHDSSGTVGQRCCRRRCSPRGFMSTKPSHQAPQTKYTNTCKSLSLISGLWFQVGNVFFPTFGACSLVLLCKIMQYPCPRHIWWLKRNLLLQLIQIPWSPEDYYVLCALLLSFFVKLCYYQFT